VLTYHEDKTANDQPQEPELKGESTMSTNSPSAPPCDPRYEDPTIPLAEALRVAIQHCNAGGDRPAADAIRSLVVLARRGAAFRAALSRIDDVLFDGESPSLNDLDAAAHADPSNMARCYSAIHEITVAAFRDEVAALTQPITMSENAHMQYIGPDWRESLERNVTVSLEFAAGELEGVEGFGIAAACVREALSECRRLLSILSDEDESGYKLRLAAQEMVSVAEHVAREYPPYADEVAALRAALAGVEAH
jgi:hypothetical protein